MPPTPAALSSLFVSELQPDWREPAASLGAELEQALERVMQRARSIPLPLEPEPAELLPHVARQLPPPSPKTSGTELLRWLGRLRVEELVLAWACARGSPWAIAEFERLHFHVVDAALAQLPDAAAQAEEIKQRLRQRLFVAQPDAAPRIGQYSGRGSLRSWLRVAAIRCALNLVQQQGRELALGDEVLANLTSPGAGQEIDHLKRRYRAEFRQAFEQALASLDTRERNLLRYHYLERLNIDQIGAIHGVHRTTVARWLARIRDTLLSRTREALMSQLRIERDEFESIMRLIDSQLEVSLARCLETLPPGERPPRR
jgi:RNA polymerase sigma-70 factor (ECF subfamily)